MSHLSQQEKLLYTDFFLRLDAEQGDGDGALNIAEFEKLLLTLGFRLSKEQVAAEFIKTDKDQNWKITLDEFLVTLPNVVPPGSPQAIAATIRRRFDENDLNKDGYITFDELKQVLADANQGKDEEELKSFVRDFIKNWDADGDGKINFEEFLEMFIETELGDEDDDEDDDEEKGEVKDNDGEDFDQRKNPIYIPRE
ncbi:calmodulin-4-like [Haliotis rufescens]|uniref:calmodulin-4-like n=1 Tax=Haliotis rufescens TaxID=6454 RepID=UPI00201F5E65|nr:calmodulin-4-like [Haliotis rufescens]